MGGIYYGIKYSKLNSSFEWFLNINQEKVEEVKEIRMPERRIACLPYPNIKKNTEDIVKDKEKKKKEYQKEYQRKYREVNIDRLKEYQRKYRQRKYRQVKKRGVMNNGS